MFGVGTGILALTLGMRHAFDADHIAAIDNTTRKLMAEGKRPMSVGFFFSLGHSTVVFVLTVLLDLGLRAVDAQVHHGASGLHDVTGVVGTTVSGAFLYVIAALNVVVLLSIVRVFRDLRRGRFDDDELERQLDQRGLMNRFFGPLARRVDAPWKMYPVGILFGLGFDTATEVALLVLSGTAVASGLPFWAILSLPVLFAAGMSLFDTLDGCFMNFAYDWAFSQPARKVYYNLVITGLSVTVAFFIGTVELLGLLGTEAGWQGGFWHTVGGLRHQHRRLRHRRPLHRHLGRRRRGLALRPDRGTVDRAGRSVVGRCGRPRRLNRLRVRTSGPRRRRRRRRHRDQAAIRGSRRRRS